MAKYDNFQSQFDLQARREETREARKLILEKAKEKYEKEEQRKKKAKKQGEGTWMLDAVSQRIQREEKTLKKARKKNKKKRKKKSKKKEESDSSSSSDDSNHSIEWIEADSSNKSATGTFTSSQMRGPQLQRESWMEAPLDLFPTISRQDIRDAAEKKKNDAKKEAEKMLAPGQHARELNPYWKDGGTGLPQKKKQSHASALLVSSLSGDGGLSWLQKAYQRCKEQAKDEGKSLEDVAAERWGSLNHLKSLIDEAEEKVRMAKEETSRSRSSDWNDKRKRHHGRNEEHDADDGDDRSYGKRKFCDRRFELEEYMSKKCEKHFKSDSSREESRKERNQRYRHDNMPEYNDARKRERDSKFDRKHHEEDRERKKRHKEDEERNYSRHLHDGKGQASRSLSSRFRKPGENDEGAAICGTNRFMTSNEAKIGKGKFQKPGDLDDLSPHCLESPSGRFSRQSKNEPKNKERVSNWTKNSDNTPRWKKATIVPENQRKDKETEEQERTLRRSRKKSSSSSTGSSSSEEEVEARQEETGKGELSNDEGHMKSPTSQKVLSEEELNDLAAKILRAEIMGEETLARELKDKLENARKMREASKSGVGGTDFSHRRKNVKEEKAEDDDGDDENIVVLSRTSKTGMVRPILGASDERGSSGRQKRKRKSVTTHGEHGERKKFFHDDDTFDLKTLVEREKAGTAEDQNSMFARLAGRTGERDLDVDDMFVSKAAKNQEEAHSSNRDKIAAILEHRKISAAMEKCQRCFNKIPKHLIIAIGTKSYLCLPPHRSLTEGHCLIVPMSHTSSATSMDEDIWHEMQHFRKSLVQMFTAQDQDIIFMETVMHLKHFPHTAIECIPLEREVGDLAPIYFKKAIQDAGPEWSDNKKLHDLSKKNIRYVIPKGFPYFSVDFGLQGGFAHVIEDEAKFPNYFGREIVGGMLDAEPSLWRRPHKQSFEDQRQKVLQFEQWWSPFDWTRDLNKDD